MYTNSKYMPNFDKVVILAQMLVTTNSKHKQRVAFDGWTGSFVYASANQKYLPPLAICIVTTLLMADSSSSDSSMSPLAAFSMVRAAFLFVGTYEEQFSLKTDFHSKIGVDSE